MAGVIRTRGVPKGYISRLFGMLTESLHCSEYDINRKLWKFKLKITLPGNVHY